MNSPSDVIRYITERQDIGPTLPGTRVGLILSFSDVIEGYYNEDPEFCETLLTKHGEMTPQEFLQLHKQMRWRAVMRTIHKRKERNKKRRSKKKKFISRNNNRQYERPT